MWCRHKTEQYLLPLYFNYGQKDLPVVFCSCESSLVHICHRVLLTQNKGGDATELRCSLDHPKALWEAPAVKCGCCSCEVEHLVCNQQHADRASDSLFKFFFLNSQCNSPFPISISVSALSAPPPCLSVDTVIPPARPSSPIGSRTAYLCVYSLPLQLFTTSSSSNLINYVFRSQYT